MTKKVLKDYIERRKQAELSSEGYDSYSYTLGLVELDAVNGLYRAIPAMDCNEQDLQLGTSSLLDDTKVSLLKGIRGDWSKVGSPRPARQ